MKRKEQKSRAKERNSNGVANPVGLFIQYWKERGWRQVSSTKLVQPENLPYCAGDCIVIEYVRGVSAMYHCGDGNAHVIRYDECPLPKAALDWWNKANTKNKPARRGKKHHQQRKGGKRGPRNNTMREAFNKAKG